jgi:ABC-type multidrug transport system fused ATPase/permease subunit
MAEAPKKKVNFSNAWQEARELIWAHRRRLLIGLGIMLVSRLAGLVLPYAPKIVVDEIIGKGRQDLLLPLALAVGGATLIQAVTSFTLSQLLGVAAQHAITDMRRTVQAHVTRLPVRFFDSTKTGVLISRIMTDPEGIRNLVGNGLVQLVGGLVTAVLALGFLIYLNWHVTVVTLLVLAAFGGVMAFAFSKLRPIFRERGKINAEVTGRLSESVSGIRVVKAYTAERSEQLVFTRNVHRLFRNVAQTITSISAVESFATLVIGAVGVVMILLGGRAVISGQMTVGDLFIYMTFTALVAAPLIQIASIGTQITEAFAGLDRIRELRRMTTEQEEDHDRAPLPAVRGDIEFHDVSFAYTPGTDVLKHISFRAPAGSTTALVGSSGSGKSTLISLVMAFNHPGSGRITVDGRDLATTRLRDYRAQLGVVLQENFLFDGTVAENIRFAKPHATIDEIRAVSKVAHAHEFVEKFEQQYDSIVGERGIKLSGGQRQRLAIARAILADPAILILDEATSSLDSESEQLIQEGLNVLRRGRTTFVIAHRLSTIQSADQILVIEAGEVVERGTHAELLGLGGRYRQLYDKQYRLERNRFVNPGEEWGDAEVEDAPAATRLVPPTRL